MTSRIAVKMDDVDAVKEILSKEPLRYSYMLAQLESEPSMETVWDDGLSAVLLQRDNVITLTGERFYLFELLNRIEPGEYRFHAVDPVAFRVIQEVAREIDDGPTWMFERSYDAMEKPGVEAEPLTEEDAKEINRYWGSGNRNARDYIKDRIVSAPTYGIRKDDELVAWCLTHYLTDKAMNLGFLHVKEPWRRKGFARALTEHLCIDAKKMGLTPVIDIYKDNQPSLSLARTMGFREIAENHWLTAELE